jgi:PAS domain S-box-containing protein
MSELRAINEKLVIASVQQMELAEEAVRSGELYRQLARNFPDGMVFVFGHDLRHTLADGTGLAALRLSKEMVEGRTIWEALPPQTCEQLEPAYRAALAGETVVLEVPFVVERASPRGQSSAERIYRVQTHPVRDDAGKILAGMAIVQDVTEQRQAEGIIRWQAHHDPLTGLPNRALLRDRLEQVLAITERSENSRPCCFWTWTASSTSTTPWGTLSVTACCRRWRPG